MAALASAWIFLPPPESWPTLAHAVEARVRELEGATLGGHRVLRVEWSMERCRITAPHGQLVAEVQLTLDGEPAADAMRGLYALAGAVMQLTELRPLAAATDVTIDRLDPAAATALAARLGLGARTPHVVPARGR